MTELARLLKDAKEMLPRMRADGELHSLADLGVAQHDIPAMQKVLSLINAVKTARGTTRVYYQDMRQEEAVGALDRLGKLTNETVSALREAEGTELTKSEVVDKLNAHEFCEDDYYSVVSLLSLAELATSAGRGRTGGIALYEAESASEEIAEAEKQVQDAEAGAERSEEEQTKKETEHEKALYPSAAKLVTDMGYQAITLGVDRRLAGEWNTPDILGYRVNRLAVLCGGSIDCVTVEVKWGMSKSAIAEANSHQRLAHRSYLLVHQELGQIEETYLVELLDKGIGLICLKDDRPVVHSAARRNLVEDTDVDSFLEIALDSEALKEIKDELARHFYQDVFARLMPKMEP